MLAVASISYRQQCVTNTHNRKMAQEKRFQHEVSRSFGALGYAYKLETDAQACPHCGRVINPRHVGSPDFQLDLRTKRLPISFKIEMKDGDVRFLHRDLTREQIEWMRSWQQATNGIALIWLVMGETFPNVTSPFARQTWLIPLDHFLEGMRFVEQKGGYRYTPLNREAILRDGMRVRDHACNVTELYAPYQLEWGGGNRWKLNNMHFLRRLIDDF